MISVVITSFNRPDLLERTVNSFITYMDYPIEQFIIIEDSGNPEMIDYLKKYYSQFTLILNYQNEGAYESIDKAYSIVNTPYVIHLEDDWEFYKGGFTEPSIKIMESNPSIMQVNLSNEQNMPIEPEIFTVDGISYRLEGTDKDGFWHGFTCNPSVRSMAGYHKTKPWTQWSTKEDFLALRELKVGKRYFELGYRAALLPKYFCKHIGIGRCTWHE